MRFANPKCPECGRQARGTVELVPGVSDLDIGDDGTAEYTGDTSITGGGETVKGPGGGLMLTCFDGHEWEGVMIEP